MNISLKRPSLETRCSHGGIQRGTPEYEAALARTRKRLATPSMSEIQRRKYQDLHGDGPVIPVEPKPPATPKEYQRNCVHCQKPFTTESPKRTICSPECERERKSLQKKALRVRKPRPRKYRKQAAA